MTWPSPGERWAIDLANQAALDDAQAEAEASRVAVQHARERRAATVLKLASGGGELAMQRWEYKVPELSAQDEWIRIPIELEIERAVSLTATLGAGCPQAPSHGIEDTVWNLHRELALQWHIQDSLNGRDWHDLANGTITQTSSMQVARVTNALGSHARLILWPYPCIAKVRRDTGATQSRENGDATDAHGLTITDVRIDVAIRTI